MQTMIFHMLKKVVHVEKIFHVNFFFFMLNIFLKVESAANNDDMHSGLVCRR